MVNGAIYLQICGNVNTLLSYFGFIEDHYPYLGNGNRSIWLTSMWNCNVL